MQRKRSIELIRKPAMDTDAVLVAEHAQSKIFLAFLQKRLHYPLEVGHPCAISSVSDLKENTGFMVLIIP